jgi:LacI family transcriptional regulator
MSTTRSELAPWEFAWRLDAAPRMWLHMNSEGMKQCLAALSREQGWKIVDLSFYDGRLPSGPPPQGVFVDLLPEHPLVLKLRKLGCHVVRIGSLPHPRDSAVPAIVEDRAAAGRLAAEHFAERRFRHVGFVGYAPIAKFDFVRMFNGFRERAIELGCECHVLAFRTLDARASSLPSPEKMQLRLREFAEWIGRVPKPIGILTIHDHLAASLSIAALDAGLTVPAQVAVLGHGNGPGCEMAPVQLSSVEPGTEVQAGAAVRLMRDLLAGKPAPKSTVFFAPRGIVVRQSTDVLAAADPAVARAIRFLWDHIEQNLSVDDVVAAASTPRRTLERVFREQVGHGIHAELHRRRLERFCELLKTTRLSVTDLAPAVGFRDKNYLHAVFRRAFRMTPRAYRLRHRK